MSDADPEKPPRPPDTECAYRASEATAMPGADGKWVARWVERVGRSGEIVKSRGGFQSEAEALAYGRKLELVARLNRC